MDRLMLPELIETPRLMLRPLKYEDAEEIFYAYASKPEVTWFLPWLTHRSVDDTRQFLNHAVAAWGGGKDFTYGIRMKASHRLIGSFGVKYEGGKAEFGYAIAPSAWNQGFATEACTAMLRILSAQPDVYRISTFIDSENHASAAVLKKCGLVCEATLSKWFRFVNQNYAVKDCSLYYLPLHRE